MPLSTRRLGACAALLTTAIVGSATTAACTATSEDPESSTSDIVGGRAANRSALVVVADRDDRYTCTGALVRSDVVLIPDDCRPSAIYVGFQGSVRTRDRLGPNAGAARRILVDPTAERPRLRGCAGFSRLVKLVQPVTGVTTLGLAPQAPTVSTTCTVVGMLLSSTDGGAGTVGEAREASMQVTSTPSKCSVDAKGVTGSIALGDLDGFLLCGGSLAGTKSHTLVVAPDARANEVRFDSLAAAEVHASFAEGLATLAGIHDAGAPVDAGPPPVPGDPCAKLDEVAGVACGNCGVKQTLCVPDGAGGLAWSPYGPCTGEGCAPGTTQSSAAGCLAGKTRTRACTATCAWDTFSVCQ